MSHLVTNPPIPTGTISRFAPAYWDIDFNTGMNATLVTTGANSMNLRAIFRTSSDMCGLYWRSVDKWDHPLFAYATNFDYRNTVLQFTISFPASLPHMAHLTQGLVMTVTDIGGNPHYVRLWNYALAGATGYSATIRLDFNAVQGGVYSTETIPWDKIESMFIGFTPIGSTDSPAHPITEAVADIVISGITVTGTSALLGIGNTALTAHELRMADGYDDAYPQTPERIVNQIWNLGYRSELVLYLGFSHYPSLSYDASGVLKVDLTKPVINQAAQQWLSDYFTRLAAHGFTICVSGSYELLASIMPEAWMQRDYLGSPALSGWSPPSSFVSPCSVQGQGYLQSAVVAAVGLARATGASVMYQVGEPWWWDGFYGGSGPCFYDASATAAYTAETGLPVPTPRLKSIYDDFSAPAQLAYLNWLQTKLGASTLALRDAVKAAHPGTPCGVLFYTPQMFNPAAPIFHIVNFPQAQWSNPAWDYVQVEDYDTVTAGNFIFNAGTLDVPAQYLGYNIATKAEYFAGFNLLPETTYTWDAIDRSIYEAANKGYRAVVVWARPQVCRDGYVYDHGNWAGYAAAASGKTYPSFPSGVPNGFSVIRTPIFSTSRIHHANGKAVALAHAAFPVYEFDLVYEVLPSAGGLQWLQQLRGFYEAMQGQYGEFGFTDPNNNYVAGQILGTGNGYMNLFAFERDVGSGGFSEPVAIVAAVDAVYLNGVAQASGWAMDYSKKYPSIRFTTPPPSGAVVTADFHYQFLCRFKTDSIGFGEFMSGLHGATLALRTVKP